jgi:DNA polymerase
MKVHPINTVAAATKTHHVLHRDYETRSVLELPKVGSYRYATHQTTEVVCGAYAFDDGPVQQWILGDPLPPEFFEAKQNPEWAVSAHNDPFESAIENHILGPRHGWPQVPLERHICTMAMSLALALPAKLELLALVLDLTNQKDRAGQRLMLMMSKPRKPRKNEDPNGGPYWFDDEERLLRLYAYNKQDVEVEREAHSRLRPLSTNEQRLWLLDQRINGRGFYVDRALAEAARVVAQAATPELNAELAQITNQAVTSINQVARFKAWLATQKCSSESLDKKATAKLLGQEDLAPPVRRALELRQSGAQAAAAKVAALLNRVDDDGRIRGALAYHKASTGRWAGNGVQPQNLKRPELEDEEINAAITAVSTGDYAHVRNLYPRPLSVIGDLMRSTICAAPGRALIGGDYNAIESRGLAFVAGEEWKLDAYRRFDATGDPRDEPYVVTASKIFGKPPALITPEERRTGKTCDLAFGYQGGLHAFRAFEPERFSDAEVEDFKKAWRLAHPRIRQFWYAIDEAAWHAVRDRGQVIHCGKVAFKCEGAYLLLRLPSGRKLAYPFPTIKVVDAENQVVVFKDASAGQWRECRNGAGAYGGVWTENVVSGLCRDLLAAALVRVEAAGYPVVLHVHDEIIAEVPEGFGSTTEFTELMTVSPSWALGLPIAAKAWSGPRFCK